jgi:hypothetical protein
VCHENGGKSITGPCASQEIPVFPTRLPPLEPPAGWADNRRWLRQRLSFYEKFHQIRRTFSGLGAG